MFERVKIAKVISVIGRQIFSASHIVRMKDASAMRAEIVKPPHRNPPSGDGGPNHREIWLRDLDGYVVVVASPDGEAALAPAVAT